METTRNDRKNTKTEENVYSTSFVRTRQISCSLVCSCSGWCLARAWTVLRPSIFFSLCLDNKTLLNYVNRGFGTFSVRFLCCLYVFFSLLVWSLCLTSLLSWAVWNTGTGFVKGCPKAGGHPLKGGGFCHVEVLSIGWGSCWWTSWYKSCSSWSCWRLRWWQVYRLELFHSLVYLGCR